MTKLPDELERLLEGERARDELSPDALDAAWNAIHGAVSNVDGAPPEPTPPASPPVAPPSALPGAATWTSRALWAGATAVVFSTGVLVGRATVPAPPSPAPPPSALVTAAPPATIEIAPVAPTVPETVTSAPSMASTRPAIAAAPSSAKKNDVPPAGSSAPPTTSTLADERALVEGARTALLRGRASDALSLAQKHERSFPNGGLAEDRDFLVLSALRDLGRSEESRAKAAAFLARYPKSALRGAVEAMAR
jgi:hypothetical protein